MANTTKLVFNPLTGNFDTVVDRVDAEQIADGSVDNTEFERLGTATDQNVPSTLVLRDGTGDFEVNEITAFEGTTKEIDLAKETFNNSSTGIQSFTGLTIDGGNTTFTIGAGTGHIADNASNEFISLTWGAFSAQVPVVASGITYVYINSSGLPFLTSIAPTPASRRNNVFLGRIVTASGTITAAQNVPVVTNEPANQIADLADALRLFVIDGNVLSPNGANLNINKSAGQLYVKGANFVTDADNPSFVSIAAGSPASFAYITQLANSTGPTTTTINPASYDNAGVVTAVPGGQVTIQRVYLFPSGNIRIAYGQNLYANITAALQALPYAPFVINPNIPGNGVLIGILVLVSSASDLSNTSQARFLRVSRFGESAIGSGGQSISSLQDAYNNSIQPEILTDSTRGAVDFRRGSGADTDQVITVQNGVGTTNFAVTGTGAITGSSATIGGSAVEVQANKGVANGYASLDGAGKVPVGQLPSAVMTFEGSWNASTNTPTLTNGVGDAGMVYIVSVAGTTNFGAGPITFEVRDYVVYNGSTWERSDASDAVTSVFGRQGAVTAQSGDYTASQVTNVPAGDIAATTVQAAINELDAEKQPLAANLTSISALVSNGLLVRNSGGTWSLRALSSGTGINITNPSGDGANPNISVNESGLTLGNIGGILPSTKGGTGVNNAGTLTYGANNITVSTTGATSVTLPTTGTLATLAGSESLTNKTLNDTSNVVLKGGNTTGGSLTIGTNDGNALFLETDNIQRFQLNNTAALSSGDAGFLGTAGLKLPAGTTGERPGAAVAGTIRLNTSTNEFEGFAAGAWQAVGGGLNEQPLKNYLKSYATAAVAPGTLSTVAATGNIATTSGLFYADTISGSAALVQSTSTALRGPANYLSAVSGGANDGSRFFQFPAFSLEAPDTGKAVSLSFDITGLTAVGWDVIVVRYNNAGTFQEYLTVAGTASAATTPSAQLPTGTTQFRGFFVSSSSTSDLYAVRFRRLAAATEQIRLDTLYVGPQQQLSSAAVTDWQSYTPVITGNGSKGTTVLSGTYRRVGDSAHIRISYVSNTVASGGGASDVTFSIPAGLVVDSTKLSYSVSPASSLNKLGSGTEFSFANNLVFSSDFEVFLFNTTAVRMIKAGSASSYRTDDMNNTRSIEIQLDYTVPIVGWSSNLVTGDRAVEEYVSHDGSSIVYGPNGALIPTSTPGGAGDLYTITSGFSTTIQRTDSFIIELQLGGTGQWIPAPALEVERLRFTGTDLIGVTVDSSSAGVVQMVRGKYRRGTGDTWASLTANSRWRVRKVSGGAAVGYPISGTNVIPEYVVKPTLTASTTINFGIGVNLVSSATPTTQTLQSTSSTDAGKSIFVKNVGAGTVTIQAADSKTIDGSSTLVLSQWESAQLMTTGTQWVIL